MNFWRSKGWRVDKVKARVSNELSGNPEERLLEVVVTLGAEFIVLQRLFSVESNGLGFDLTILDVNLVSTENNGDVLTDTNKITMPLRNILVGHTTGDIKHDNCGISLDTKGMKSSNG